MSNNTYNNEKLNSGDTGNTKAVLVSERTSKPKGKRTLLPDDDEFRKGTTQDIAIDESNKALFESINSYRRDEMTADEYWERIFYVHLKTKELYILAEEYGSELRTFYLPINSLKDAYEHVIRVCANDYMAKSGAAASNQTYVRDNLKNALVCECKAFFDTADFLSILLRKKIAECLSAFSYPQISSVWDEYNGARLNILRINQEISEIRNKKSETSDYYIDANIEKYYNETKKLLDYYIFIEEKVYPKLHQRFSDI